MIFVFVFVLFFFRYVRTGVSQIINKLSYPAIVSHLRRIVIPVGKEGKNVKIRQIDPSQLFFVDIIESSGSKTNLNVN